MNMNLILSIDSYKASHFAQFPPGTTGLYSYLESRGGRFGSTLFFGLQYLLKSISGYAVQAEDVVHAQRFFEAHGEPFPFDGWMHIVTKHEGHLPIRIKAVPEGTVVPTNNVLMTVESTDPEVFWLVSWLETQIVRGAWYPTTVATQSYYIKRTILEFLQETANDPRGELPFKLHDFGARGVSSQESAGIGGMAHLVNFQGSDTVEGIQFANHYYGTKGGMSGFSIPAAEHATITSWGKDGEEAAYRNMIRQFAKPGKIVAVVSDSYDVFNAVENLWGDKLKQEVQESGGTIVIRPDSGHPATVVVKLLQILERKVGMEKNLRGYKVLPSYFRLIQGDGVDQDSISEILTEMKTRGYSASNIAFGMGGALLQKGLDRDTQRFAYKCSEATINGQAVPVFKDPVTDQGKKSKAGRLALVMQDGKLTTVAGPRKDDLLVPVFENGELLREYTLDEVRETSERGLW